VIIGAIIGPTASGKTTLALELAKRNHWELISVDSCQVYEGMPIGTAQPTPAEVAHIPLHLTGFLSPQLRFSAGDCYHAVQNLLRQNTTQKYLLVGGTGFYLKALAEGLAEIPPITEEVRCEVRELAKVKDSIAMHELLRQFDPHSAKRLLPSDTQRVQRALEVYWQTKQTWAEFLQCKKPPLGQFPLLLLEHPREVLYQRINARTGQMWQEGWVTETQKLMHKFPNVDALPAMQSLGYRSIIAHLRGFTNPTEALERIKQDTRRFAKRQITFLRHQLTTTLIQPHHSINEVEQLLCKAHCAMKKHSKL
jgi:tRNA dimethylallyltransferase